MRRELPQGFTVLGPGRAASVGPFLAMVFLSWLVWIPAGARMAGVLPFYFPTEIAWLGVFSPLILGTYFVYRHGGAQGLRLHFARFTRWRFEARYWVFAALAMPLIAAGTAALYSVAVEPILGDGLGRLADGTVMAASMERFEESSYESIGLFSGLNDWMGSSALAFVIGTVVLGFVDGGISEEPGWRGFAYPVLQDRWGALPAALTIGLVWAAWHMGPRQWAILFGEGHETFLAFLPGYLLTYVLGVAPLAIIFSWLYENTRGSLLAVFVVHNSFNQTSTTVGAMFPGVPIIVGVIVFLWLVVAYILATADWRSFGRRRRRRG